MVLPGIQALFGFQLVAVFNPRFDAALDRPQQTAAPGGAAAGRGVGGARHDARGVPPAGLPRRRTRKLLRVISALVSAALVPLMAGLCSTSTWSRASSCATRRWRRARRAAVGAARRAVVRLSVRRPDRGASAARDRWSRAPALSKTLTARRSAPRAARPSSTVRFRLRPPACGGMPGKAGGGAPPRRVPRGGASASTGHFGPVRWTSAAPGTPAPASSQAPLPRIGRTPQPPGTARPERTPWTPALPRSACAWRACARRWP